MAVVYETRFRASGVPRLLIRLPIPDTTVVTVKAFIEAGLVTAQTALFANAVNRQLYTAHLGGGFIAKSGYIEHGAPGIATPIYLMSRLKPRDITPVPPAVVPPSSAEMVQYGIPIDEAYSRHYVDGIDLDYLFIHATSATSMFVHFDICFGHSRG